MEKILTGLTVYIESELMIKVRDNQYYQFLVSTTACIISQPFHNSLFGIPCVQLPPMPMLTQFGLKSVIQIN